MNFMKTSQELSQLSQKSTATIPMSVELLELSDLDGIIGSATYHPDQMHTVLGFRIEITGAGSGGDVDSAWETCTGGSLNIEVSDVSIRRDFIEPH